MQRSGTALSSGRVSLVLVTVAVLLSACGSDDSSQSSDGGSDPTSPAATSPEATEPAIPEDPPSASPTPLDPQSPADLPTGPAPTGTAGVENAIADLAQREGVSEQEIEVSGYAEVTWSSGAIGCPEPGQAYTEALVPGAQLILVVDGERFSYHAEQTSSGQADFFYCASPEVPVETRQSQ